MIGTDLLIQVEVNHYVVRLNGIVVLDFTGPSPLSFDGYIALQLHSGGEGNMKFKDIPSRKRNPKSIDAN
jgi:hypothetical protein